jgi:hypothetical protein
MTTTSDCPGDIMTRLRLLDDVLPLLLSAPASGDRPATVPH